MSVKPASPALIIRAFDGHHVETPGGQALRLSGKKERALLGFFSVPPGVIYQREILAARLWSEGGDQQARDSLKQAFLRPRRGPAHH